MPHDCVTIVSGLPRSGTSLMMQMLQVLYADYREVLSDPAAAAQTIARFLGGGLDVSAMAGAVDRTLYRQRPS